MSTTCSLFPIPVSSQDGALITDARIKVIQVGNNIQRIPTGLQLIDLKDVYDIFLKDANVSTRDSSLMELRRSKRSIPYNGITLVRMMVLIAKNAEALWDLVDEVQPEKRLNSKPETISCDRCPMKFSSTTHLDKLRCSRTQKNAIEVREDVESLIKNE